MANLARSSTRETLLNSFVWLHVTFDKWMKHLEYATTSVKPGAPMPYGVASEIKYICAELVWSAK